MGVHQGTLGRVWQYAPGAAISPFIKGVEHSAHFSVSAQSDHPHSIDQVHPWTFLPKLITTSLEHCLMMSQWNKGFLMITFMSVLRRCKRRKQETVRVPVPVEPTSSFKLAFPRVLWCILALGQPGISTFKWNHVFGFLFNHSCALLNQPCLHFHQSALFERLPN